MKKKIKDLTKGLEKVQGMKLPANSNPNKKKKNGKKK
jgi:hypothetical protein